MQTSDTMKATVEEIKREAETFSPKRCGLFAIALHLHTFFLSKRALPSSLLLLIN